MDRRVIHMYFLPAILQVDTTIVDKCTTNVL
jgi:hypothetical protein